MLYDKLEFTLFKYYNENLEKSKQYDLGNLGEYWVAVRQISWKLSFFEKIFEKTLVEYEKTPHIL